MNVLENLELRRQVAEIPLHWRDVARQIGVTPEHLSRVLRYPLKPEMYVRIVTAIQFLKDKGGGGGGSAGNRAVSG